MGLPIEFHPYLFLVFFSTIFVYNLNRIANLIKPKESLESENHIWVKNNLFLFKVINTAAVAGIIVSLLLVKIEVFIFVIPLAIVTYLYSFPIKINSHFAFRLRNLPYLKIFLIAWVWSCTTVILPVVFSKSDFTSIQLMSIWIMRFLFVLAITIPFDIRDLKADRLAGIKTIPTLVGEQKAIQLSSLILILVFMLSIINDAIHQTYGIGVAIAVSMIVGLVAIRNSKIRKLSYYHYGILDGCILLQSILVIIADHIGQSV
ncbi:MAG: UbiA family prenyltransferase [Saprospiraceae bacterium]|nr:UbiA family prenyltransferase [Saprospiraceae bacterium]